MLKFTWWVIIIIIIIIPLIQCPYLFYTQHKSFNDEYNFQSDSLACHATGLVIAVPTKSL